MNEKKKKVENKKEDQKFLGKFLIVLLISFLVGIAGGFCIAFLKDATELPQLIRDAVLGVIVPIAPYMSLVFVVIMTIVLIIAYKKAKAMAKAWDGENEEEYERVDNMLGNVLSVFNVSICIVYFFFAVGFETIPDNALISLMVFEAIFSSIISVHSDKASTFES